MAAANTRLPEDPAAADNFASLAHRALVRGRRSTWAVVDWDGLEGVVAKPLNSRYTPGDRRAWLKVKNGAYWKYELEREAAIDGPRHRTLRAQPA